MSLRSIVHGRFWKLFPLLQFLGCSEVVLQTTDETATSSTPSISDAGIVSGTFFVSGQTLMDPCGKPVVLRGVNEMMTFLVPKDGNPYLDEIAKTGANSVRIYWRTTDTADELDLLLKNAEAHRLIPVIYVFNYQPNTTSITQAADYWTRSDIAPVVNRHAQWLLIDLSEKELQAPESAAEWASSIDAAVKRLRQASINVPIVVDAPQYGLDTGALTLMGKDLIALDPQQNLLFNVNAWWSNANAETVRSNITSVTNIPLPLMIGEFSAFARQQPCMMPSFDYLSLLQVAEDSHIGWEAWSWGAAFNIDCSNLNMTNGGSFATLSGWGLQVARDDINSIKNKSVLASYAPGAGCTQ